MSSDCAFSKSNPFEKYQGDTAGSAPDDEGVSIYSVSITVTNGAFSDSMAIAFTNSFGKPAGSFSGMLIPSNLAAGTYAGTAVLAGTVASYAGQQIIALATQVGGANTINFATASALVGSVTSAKLDVSCSAGLFDAKAPS